MRLLAVFLCFASVFGAPADESVDGLLDKVAQAYGGRSALEKPVVIRETGRVEAAPRMANSGSLVRVVAPKLKLRVQVGEPGRGGEVRLLNGDRAWRDGQRVKGAPYEAMVLQALRLGLPEELLAHKPALVERKPMEYGGKQLRVLELPLDHGLSLSAGIDPATGRILFSSGLSANLPSGPMSFETYYDDFREVGGRLFAFKEISMAGGFKTAEILLSKIEILDKPPDGAFEP